MANKQINELTEKSDVLVDDDLILVWDSEESGSEKSKKVAISNYVATINSNLTLYVDPAGSDTIGDGTSGNPWATPNKALDWLSSRFIQGGAGVTIQLSDGTYNLSSLLYSVHPNGGAFDFKGNISTPSNVILNFAEGESGFYCDYNSTLRLTGLKIVGGGTQDDYGVSVSRSAFVELRSCIIDNWDDGVTLWNFGNLYATSCVFNNCGDGVFCNSVSSSYIYSCTMSNNTNGVSSHRGSTAYVLNPTFSGNSQNTNATLNGVIYTE